MKKYIYSIMVLGLVFTTACDPMEDIYDTLDAKESAIVGDASYTLTDDDYDYKGFELTRTNFGSKDDAKTKIPAFLTDKYPVWGKGSTVVLGYNLYIGSAFGARDYNLNQADYTSSGSDLLGFKSDAVPSDYLAKILADNVSNAKEGDYRVAKYFQYTGSAYTVTPKVSLEENFDYGASNGILTTLTSDWAHHSGAPDQLAYDNSSLSMTNYPTSSTGGSMMMSSAGSEDLNKPFTPINSGTVYYSTLINLSTVGTGTYFIHFMEQDGSYNYAARIGAKNNGSDKILFGLGASSSSLTYGKTPYELDTTYLLVASYDIATGTANLHVLTTAEATEPGTPEVTNTGNKGYSIQRIGVRQGKGGPTAKLDGIRVANTWSSIMSNADLDDEVVGTKVSKESSYTYKGGVWEVPSDRFYLLSEADFASIGVKTFGSSNAPDDYLATFLKLKFPYAQEEDELDVAYNYLSSSSGAQVRGNLYTVINGEWVAYKSTISTTLQFGHDGDSWVPDNTISYTLTSDDFAFLGAELKDNSDFSNVSLVNMANYNNFDYNWKANQILLALGLVADKINPTAIEGQKYLFAYKVYDNGLNEVSMKLIKTGSNWILYVE